MTRPTKRYCPNCGHKTLHQTATQDDRQSEVCTLCELLEQQVREGENRFDKNSSFSTDPKDMYEALRSWGGPFGGGLAG
jgi:transcription elongation factor Elf1